MREISQDADLVLAFLNTVDVEDGTDVLDDPRAWQQWVAERGLGRPGTPRTVRRVRDALRTAVSHGQDEGAGAMSGACDDGGTVSAAAKLPPIPVGVRLDAGMPTLDADDAVGWVLAAAVRLAVAGEWSRIKICPAADCRWTFYDRSRNRSRSWCSMEACGNRAKARQFRQRLRARTD